MEFTREGRGVVDYSVVLVVDDEGEARVVRVYDVTPGVNELHRHTREGGKQPGEVFHAGTLGDGMRDAIRPTTRKLRGDDRVMAQRLKHEKAQSPVAQAMDHAIESALAGEAAYPDGAVFISADEPQLGQAIRPAVDDGAPVVLVFADGTTRVLRAS